MAAPPDSGADDAAAGGVRNRSAGAADLGLCRRFLVAYSHTAAATHRALENLRPELTALFALIAFLALAAGCLAGFPWFW